MPKNRDKASKKLAETLRVAILPDPGATAKAGQIASLLVVQGAEVDLGRHVVCDKPITIGRDVNADLMLNDGSISRAHCKIDRAPQGSYVLLDLGSTNGTLVNGAKIQRSMQLKPGDKIFLGASVVRFDLSDPLDVQFHNKLEEIVTTDALTGLGTKRQYDALFRAVSERCVADELPLSVVVMDMDGLKQINDSHGHEMGSFAIAECSKVVRKELEAFGHLARFGGDEFVGCFPGVAQDTMLALCEQTRIRIAQHRFIREGVQIRPTLSLGIATYPYDTGDPEQLFGIADQALYRAKRGGKNRVATVPIES